MPLFGQIYDWVPRVVANNNWPLDQTLFGGITPFDLSVNGINSGTGLNQIIAKYNKNNLIIGNGKPILDYITSTKRGLIDLAFKNVGAGALSKITSAAVGFRRTSLDNQNSAALPDFQEFSAKKNSFYGEFILPSTQVASSPEVRQEQTPFSIGDGDPNLYWTITRNLQTFTVFDTCVLMFSGNTSINSHDFYLSSGINLNFTPIGTIIFSGTLSTSSLILCVLTPGTWTLMTKLTDDDAAYTAMTQLDGTIFQTRFG